MFNKKDKIAIVGASNNKDKYGYKVLLDLYNSGFNVIPINLKEKEILNLKVYPNLSSVEDIDSVVFITQPEITEKILTEVKELGIKNVWMQPGSESDKGLEYCNKNSIKCIHNACIMIKKDEIV